MAKMTSINLQNTTQKTKEMWFHPLLTLSLDILNIIYTFFLITSINIQSIFIIFKQKKYLKLVSREVVKIT
jgi:hypothetical protein